ncbi:hypothetical protein [Flavobacterium sp.]|uniref:hypothetical protein n=1 Tax=Flavobacterium sp. TaxID=239 RepID=UPI003D0BFB5E
MEKMKKIYLALAVISGVLSANAQNFKKVIGFNHIESVTHDDEFLYISDIGVAMKPTDKDGDGKILKLDRDGKIVDANYIKEKLNAPKGLTIANGVLFVADIDKIIAFEVKTGSKLYEVDFAGETTFLNDIIVWNDTTLYVTATDKSKIYKVDLSENKFEPIATDVEIKGANGLFADKENNRIWVNGFGANSEANGVMGYISLADNKFSAITPIEGYYDGLYVYDGVVYFSNWMAFEKKGIIASMSLIDKKVKTVELSEPISGPADFTVFKNRIIVPGMLDGSLNFITIQKESLYIH